MKERMLSKGLIVGVILLFIGISIQPAIAVNPISSDSEEDCSICPKVSSLQIVRLKEFIDKLEMYEVLKPDISWKNKPICEFLALIMQRIVPWGAFILNFYYESEHNPISLQFFVACLGVAVINLFWLPICFLAFEVFDCVDWNPHY